MTESSALRALRTASPGLSGILDYHGDESVYSYFLNNLAGAAPVPEARQQEFFDALRAVALPTLGTALENAIADLRRSYGVCTADHHGPIAHPYFVSSNLLSAAVRRARGLTTVIDLAYGGISMSNSSFPRGLLFHNVRGEERRLLFAPWRDRRMPVYAYPRYEAKTVERMRARIEHEALTDEERERLDDILMTIYAGEALALPTYADQVTHTNAMLWKRIRGEERTAFAYIEMEKVVAELLISGLTNGSELGQLLTDAARLDAFEQHFDGVRGAFSSKDSTGTFLFWQVDTQRHALHRCGQALSSEAGFEVALADQPLIEALRTGMLMPSLALCCIVMLHVGVQCSGGTSQVTYLTNVRDAYTRVLGADAEETPLFSIKTDVLGGDIQLVRLDGGVPATVLDLVIREVPVDVVSIAQGTTVKESLERTLECYTL